MSLILEGAALAIEGAALVIDCACCIGELCDLRACVTEIDCTDAGGPNADCYCRGNQCVDDPSCTDDDDCPDGLVCIDGECLPPCRGQQCGGTEDCPEGCVCVDGGCFDPEDIYYCWGEKNDPPDADGECKQGVPPPPDYTNKGGPYLSLGLCAQSGCKTKYSCNPVVEDCYPDAAGIYEDLVTCQQNCGDGGDKGRCCQTTVWYDADGNVERNESTCADCCGGTKEPTNPDEPDQNILKCENTVPCSKSDCVSDRLEDVLPYPTKRVFRQFNSLYRNCDGCPATGTGPCCHEDTDPDSPTFQKPICSLVSRTTCTEVLEGEWKGDTWWTCEDEREDTGRDYACPDCNGGGDCECEQGEFCFGNRCNSCQNPNTNPTKTGSVVEVRFDDYTGIDADPKVYRKYYFRVLTCPGQNLDQVKNEPVNIYGKIAGDDVYTLLLTVDNRDVDSLGYTTYEDDECYTEIVARKADGIPSRIGLCYFWQDPPISRPDCVPETTGCYCDGGTEEPDATYPVGATVNCNQPDGIDMIYESWDWFEIGPQARPRKPVRDVNFTVNGCAERLYANSTGFWMREYYDYLWSERCDASSYTYEEDRYIAALPDGSFADVTDEWFTPLPVEPYENSLVRTSHYSCDDCTDDGECTSLRECVGSFCENLLGLTPPMEKPDPLMVCNPIRRKLTNPNPLP